MKKIYQTPNTELNIININSSIIATSDDSVEYGTGNADETLDILSKQLNLGGSLGIDNDLFNDLME